MRVSPEASPPNIKERCEIDLSPGTRAVPERADDLRAVAGFGSGGVRHGISLDGMPARRRFSFVAAVSYHGGRNGHPQVVTWREAFQCLVL